MAQRRKIQDGYPGKDIFRELSDLLRENGEKILSGQSKLSLTTNCLHILNENFTHISDPDFLTSFEVVPPNTPKLPQYDDLQFLYDFIQKTLSLKLIQGSHTLQGRVNIAQFRSLQTLELKKTPLHMIEGIHNMRSKLNTLICTRCLRQVQDLIETCGGDMSSPMSWQNLHTASFSYNSISELDSSMRLLPAVEVLDLSHNNLRKTENYLEYLTEIHVLSLGFNQIECIPTFSLSGRSKLQILVLRNNNLDNLTGLEELTGLRELDLANNCLCDHRDLEPVRALHKLNKLTLEGNPLCYHSEHRMRCLEHVHPLTLGRLMLDGKSVTQQEAMYCRKFHEISHNSWENISITPDTSRRLPHVSSASSFDFVGSSTSQIEDKNLVSNVRSGKGGRRKSSKKAMRKARKAQITDASDGEDPVLDNSSEASYSTTPQDDSFMEVKQNLETARQQLGPDWLQYLVHNKMSPNQKREDLAREAVLANGVSPHATDDDIFLNADEPVINSEVTDLQTTKHQESAPSRSRSHSRDDVTDGNTLQNGAITKELRKRHESHESDTIINWKGSSTELEADYGVESEPFIVFHPDEESQSQMIITVTERYILEKDLNGEVMETLDLKCLQTIATNEEMISTISMEGVHVEMYVIRLTFDYVKKNRRERAYVMEDMENAQSFEELLRPALDENLAVLKLKDTMHCLKCGEDFSKSQANVKVKRFGNQSNNDIYASNVERDVLEEVLLCPFCGGSMVIQVENQQQIAAGGGSNFATPVGSYTMSLQESLSTPRKHSTPAKLLKEDDVSIASSSFKSIPDGSVASANFMSMNTTRGQDSTAYKSLLTNTLNNSDASFDVLDSSKAGSIDNSKLLGSSTNMGSFSSISSSRDSNKTYVEGASRNLFSSGQVQVQRKRSLTSEKAPQRSRQDSTCSTGSDIIVLKTQSSQAESDITLLTNPSQSSIAVIDQDSTNPFENSENNNLLDKSSQPVTFTIAGDTLPGMSSVGSGQLQTVMESSACDAELSPMGSLTNKTLNSMVSSMYEKSLVSDSASISSQDSCKREKYTGIHRVSSNESFLSAAGDSDVTRPDGSENVAINKAIKNLSIYSDSSPSIYSASPALSTESGSDTDDSSKLYRYDNCNYIDHRLKLHLTMNVFSKDEEDFRLILRCGCMQYSKSNEFPCLLVLSSTTIYIMKITGQESSSNFEKWLKVVQSNCINNLQFVDIGLGHQSFHAEFVGDNASFTFLIRDERRCKSFLRQFTKLVTAQATSSKSRLEGISKHNSATLANLESKVLHINAEDEEIDETVLKFSLGYMYTGEVDSKGDKTSSPVSILVTPTHVFLIDEDYNWPLPRAVSATAVKNAQFALRDRQRINDITSVDLYQEASHEISVHFMDEETNEECSWHIAMETDDALLSLLSAVREPWEKQFEVQLQVNIVQSQGTSS